MRADFAPPAELCLSAWPDERAVTQDERFDAIWSGRRALGREIACDGLS